MLEKETNYYSKYYLKIKWDKNSEEMVSSEKIKIL